VIYESTAPEGGLLDTELTSELREEGTLREIGRIIQDMRQKAGFKPKEKAVFHIYAESEEINKIILDNIVKLKSMFSLKNIILQKDDDMKVIVETKVAESEIWTGIR